MEKSVQFSSLNRGSYLSAHVLLTLFNEFGKRDKMRGLSRTRTKWPPTGFHSTANFFSLQHPENMPSKYVNSGHHRSASKTPSEWRFAVRLTVAWDWMVAGCFGGNIENNYSNKWAVTWDFQQCDMCEQQSLGSACAYAQSDQSLW